MVLERRRQSKFKVGDRVISVAGFKGTVTRLGRDELVLFVRWDDYTGQELTRVSTLWKLIDEERANKE